jgi:ACR3 family arsenite transporter
MNDIDQNMGCCGNVKEDGKGLDIFGKYLTLWVALCIIAGVAIGQLFPPFPKTLSKFEYAHVSIPVAILIWLMIYPMMLKIDFSSIIKAMKEPKGLTVTWVTNWLIKPFTMYLIASFFLKVVFRQWISPELATDYLAGAILLGAAPCTAMVFVWSYLTKGNPAYTLVQVATNDLIILFAFTPIVAFLLGVSNVKVPYDTLFLSVVLFVVIPLTAGYLSRKNIIKYKGIDYFENVFLKKFDNVTIIGLLLTLIILFSFQGDIILKNPQHIVLIAVPLTIQTFLIFFIAYIWSKLWKLPHDIAAPAAMIGASNFFELAVAVAISLFGLDSGAALATVVGVLTEVPIMLTLVRIANATRSWFTIKP